MGRDLDFLFDLRFVADVRRAFPLVSRLLIKHL